MTFMFENFLEFEIKIVKDLSKSDYFFRKI